MIKTAQEFKILLESENNEKRLLARNLDAKVEVWHEVIDKYPELKEWVVLNKTIQLEILKILAKDPNESVRATVARKRKIDREIFDILKNDSSESVRHSLMCNTKVPIDLKKEIKVDDSEWLANELKEKQ